ncbi:MAG: transposase [Planctomycetota bacterium]
MPKWQGSPIGDCQNEDLRTPIRPLLKAQIPRKPPKRRTLDMDSSLSEPYGRQEGSAYNGHFGCTCYHPLFLLSQFGDLQRAMLRRGNHASAKFWRDCHITRVAPTIFRNSLIQAQQLLPTIVCHPRPSMFREPCGSSSCSSDR